MNSQKIIINQDYFYTFHIYVINFINLLNKIFQVVCYYTVIYIMILYFIASYMII